MTRPKVTIDGNEAAAYVAHKVNEVIAIYPITPSSPMGEWSDQWSSEKKPNIWGTIPTVVEMQSEGGAAGALHGALQAGALGTTFTSSQGLLLMIPNMYKIAGELTPTVIHVAARAIATHALSIFGDHQDAMGVRATGFALLSSNSVQEVMDMALIAQASTLESRVPFVHFFDGFRTSHEVSKLEQLDIEDMRAMIDDDLVRAHRARALSPDHPVLRGSAQNPDVYFQARETVNPFYMACPSIVQKVMDRFANLTGREYKLFDYVGAPDAERIIVIMGSGAEAAQETVEYLVGRGEKVGLVKVRLYRPFAVESFIQSLPATVKKIAVLDRTKEPGCIGEPLYLDVMGALSEGGRTDLLASLIGGRYGLSSKEFTPAMVKGVLDELSKEKPKNHFTVGIVDDVTRTSIAYDPEFSSEDPATVRCLFYGLGADGTVGANKNSIKIIGEETDNYAQGYFVYDSKKSGSSTISHLRFGPKPIRSTYLITRANFVACHQFTLLEKLDVLQAAEAGAVFLLNSPYSSEEVWDKLPRTVQEQIIQKKLKFYVIDGYEVAKQTGMGQRINTIMQTCFFAISGVLPREEAIERIKYSIKKTYGKRGETVVQRNFAAVDATLDHLHEVKVPAAATGYELPPIISPKAPDFVQHVLGQIIAGNGDLLPVSAFPVDGTFPTATAQWEKRNIALEVPVWDEKLCIQCGKCVLICPHAVIRSKIYESDVLKNAPAMFKSATPHWKELKDKKYSLQVAVEDCTGCGLCVQICPVKDKSNVGRRAVNMAPQIPLRETERENWDFFLTIPDYDRTKLAVAQVKENQLLRPLFEFSGACTGCGETPYVKLMTQLFGDRALIGNATGCSSIYGGNLPTTPYCQNADGRGPSWSNSLFEDNAEFGLGMRLSIDFQNQLAKDLLKKMESQIGGELVKALLEADQSTESGIAEQRMRVAQLRERLTGINGQFGADVKNLLAVAESLVKKSVWIVGGDGWAYDIGYGGLDHVLASGKNVNVLVLDTEVYSNTGGQMSKATPRGAVAKFAAGGKPAGKKDLGAMAMMYGNVYVAHIAMGSNDAQTVKAFMEAEAWDGPSIIIAYSHCIAHGYDLVHGIDQQRLAVNSGYWPLWRYNPALALEGKNPFKLDSRAPAVPLDKYIYNETRYTMLVHSDPEAAKRLLTEAQQDVNDRWKFYEQLAAMTVNGGQTAEKTVADAPKKEVNA